MTPKLSAYQKLKAKNILLRQQLDIVCNEPDTSAAMGIKSVWKLNRQIENQIMSGTPISVYQKQNT